MKLRLNLVLPFLVVALLGWTLVQARVPQPAAEYQKRRADLLASLPTKVPVVLFGYTGEETSGSLDRFFQEENFYYLTGHNEPGAALLLIPDPPAGNVINGPRQILYLPPRNLGVEKWEGPRMGCDDSGLVAKSGFDSAECFDRLKPELEKLAAIFSGFYTVMPRAQENGYPHDHYWADWMQKAMPTATLYDVRPILGALRQVKSPGELALIQRAVDLSVDAQLDAIERTRPGLYEYQVAARMEFIHLYGGCDREAYAPIVGTGFHSTVLHYADLGSQIADGDIVVMDVAGEYGGYAADITRTIPANGKYTQRQLEIYNIVLGAQNAALAALKPGMAFGGGANSLQKIATDYIDTHGKDSEGRPLGRYFIHGLGHHIGLDVHDAGDSSRPFLAGMVVTMEPGIYISEENLGVRIEDDVLITADGYKLLSERLPRDPEKIEKLMAEGKERLQNSTP
jgi:Xaa-Pro aminopeptidase